MDRNEIIEADYKELTLSDDPQASFCLPVV